MVRISDRIWNHVEKTDAVWKCTYCAHVFAKGIAAQIVKCHLAGVGGPGTKFCSNVPGHVKMEARREINEGEKKRRIIMSTSPSSSSNVTVEVSPKNDGERTIEQETKLRSRDGGGVERESDQEMIEAEIPDVMVKNGVSVCEICWHEYERRTPAKRRQWHLADIEGSGHTICTSMPDDVKGATLREITESERKRRKTVPGSNHSEDVPTMSIEDVAVQPLEAGWSGFTKALEDFPNEPDHGVRDEKMVEVEDASVKDSSEQEITGVPPGDLMQPTEKDHEQSGDIAKGNIAMDVKEAAQRIEEEAVEADEFSSSSATIREAKRYDVFLSFRGEDTRNGFTSHLHKALRENKIETFIDYPLTRGDDIYPAVFAAIENSDISLIIFSENYSDSKWCLKELARILQCRKLNGQIVIPVFYGVDPSDIKNQTGKFGVAFDKLKERLRKEEMDLDDVRSHLKEAANLSGWNSHNIRPESELIKSIVGDILEKLNLISNRRQRTMPDVLPIVATVGDAFGINVEKILSWLMDDQVLRVGIYGAGGVGKTILMRHIQTLLKEQSSFEVYWITVSQDFSIYELQNLIAKKIGLNFSDEEDEVKRAKSLAQAMHAKGKCVLILDDLWNYFDVDEVGIPVGVNPCKLVLTTRLLKVCRQMDCSEGNTIQVQRLSDEEAWILFSQELGNYSTEVEELAKAVSRECAGLPLGIIVMARSMKGICNVHTWRNTLEELKELKVTKGHEMREEVFSVLKISYLRLKDPALKECLSYCTLYPVDEKIDRNKLIEYMIVEGIIDERSRQAELDKGHAMLDTLENACLLEGGTENVWPMELEYDPMFPMDDVTITVWMHDLIRDMVILELREGSKTLVEAGAQLKELPDVERWTENLVRVSLISNDIEVIPSGHTPRCPNLSTLLLCRNHGLKKIADSFFEQFQRLKVLDLTWCNEIKKLPGSISNLVNLTALLLHECKSLIHVPSLAKLERLKKLDLHGCKRLKDLPEGVEFLLTLKYLDLCGSGIEEIGSGIIPMLSRLQVLKLCETHDDSKFSVRGSEVGELRMLETLHCVFSNVTEFGEYMKSRERSRQSLSDYFFVIRGEDPYWPTIPRKLGSRKSVCVKGYSFIDPLALPTDIEALNIYECYIPLYKRLFPPSLLASLLNLQEICVNSWFAIEEIFAMNEGENGEWGGFPFSNYPTHSLSNHSLLNLKLIEISECYRLKKLFPPSLLPNLHNLQKISVNRCLRMEEIFSTNQEEEDNHNLTGLHLSKLTTLELRFLPELRSIYKGAIICHSLQQIELLRCPKLKRITLPLPQPSLQRIRVYPKEWWESLHWGEANDKNHLESLCVFKECGF